MSAFCKWDEGWPLYNSMGHYVITISLNYRLVTPRAGAKGVNVFLQVNLEDWFA